MVESGATSPQHNEREVYWFGTLLLFKTYNQ